MFYSTHNAETSATPADQTKFGIPERLSLASLPALSILAVDGICPSSAGVALMQSIDSGAITRTQAIQSVIDRARLYAKRK